MVNAGLWHILHGVDGNFSKKVDALLTFLERNAVGSLIWYDTWAVHRSVILQDSLSDDIRSKFKNFSKESVALLNRQARAVAHAHPLVEYLGHIYDASSCRADAHMYRDMRHYRS